MDQNKADTAPKGGVMAMVTLDTNTALWPCQTLLNEDHKVLTFFSQGSLASSIAVTLNSPPWWRQLAVGMPGHCMKTSMKRGRDRSIQVPTLLPSGLGQGMLFGPQFLTLENEGVSDGSWPKWKNILKYLRVLLSSHIWISLQYWEMQPGRYSKYFTAVRNGY